jgi:chromosome transmission fidelity protein 1
VSFTAGKPLQRATPVLHVVESFMLAVTAAAEGLCQENSCNIVFNCVLDGRIIFSVLSGSGKEEVEVKYQSLNPSTHFQEIVGTARSIILAGGTMSPVCHYLHRILLQCLLPSLQMSDVVAQLFSDLPLGKFSTFSCGHIIPPSNLQTLVLCKGPRGGELEFKYSQQKNNALVRIKLLVLF